MKKIYKGHEIRIRRRREEKKLKNWENGERRQKNVKQIRKT